MNNDRLHLPWSFRHAQDGLDDFGYLVDAEGTEIATVYVVHGCNKAQYIKHILDLVNGPAVVDAPPIAEELPL